MLYKLVPACTQTAMRVACHCSHCYGQLACVGGRRTRQATKKGFLYFSENKKINKSKLIFEKSTHDAYENTWKYGELNLYFSHPICRRIKKEKRKKAVQSCV